MSALYLLQRIGEALLLLVRRMLRPGLQAGYVFRCAVAAAPTDSSAPMTAGRVRSDHLGPIIDQWPLRLDAP